MKIIKINNNVHVNKIIRCEYNNGGGGGGGGNVHVNKIIRCEYNNGGVVILHVHYIGCVWYGI